MFHYVNAITNTKGDALIGYYVAITSPSTGDVVDIYADESATPIVSVSGEANKAKVDSNGNVSFYVVGGTYNLDIYATDATTLVQTISGIPMEDLGSVPATVASVDAMALLTPESGDSCILVESGRQGRFVFSDEDLSAEVTADTEQGIYVAPDSDDTGASGAWVRQYDGAVNVKWFGAHGDGATDDTDALQSAIDSVGAAGGTVYIPNGMRCVVDSNLTVKPNVSLIGAFKKVGSPKDNTSYPYDQLSGVLLNSAATITLKGGAGVDGLLIQRKGITYPATIGSFAGTALTAGGDDTFVTNSMVLGFAQAYTLTNFQRPRLTDVQIDCTAGIYMSGVADVPYIQGVHCWCFTNVGSGGLSLAHRSGSAFHFVNCDWPKITDCFAYGYFRGINSDGSDDLVAVNCSIDGTQLYSGSIGVAVSNDALRNRFIGLHVSSQDIGAYINTSASSVNRVELVASSVITSTSHNVLIDAGDLAATASSFMNAPDGIAIADAASKVSISNCKFASITSSPINCVPANSNVAVRDCDFGTFLGIPVGGAALQTVASAATLTLPQVGEDFLVSGTTGISAIQYGWAGRKVRLIFQGSLTVTHGTSLKLAGGSNFAATADDALTLVSDGSSWREVSRASASGAVTVSDAAYSAAWNGSLEVPTKNAVYDKIETVIAGVGSYTDENAQDAIATMISAGTNTGLSVSYNDAGNAYSLAIDTTAEAERIRDTIGTALVAGSNITITVNDASDTITIAAPSAAYTDENAQDAVGGILTDSASIDFTYDDAGNSITAIVKDSSITYAKIQNVSATSRILGRITTGAGVVEELTAANVKTILGLAQADISGLTTADSPQFTAINLGHASDTTISRVSAGDIAVEGNTVYRSGGTDVAVTDGGTGASTASGARTNLGLGTAAVANLSIGTSAPGSPATNDLWVDTN